MWSPYSWLLTMPCYSLSHPSTLRVWLLLPLPNLPSGPLTQRPFQNLCPLTVTVHSRGGLSHLRYTLAFGCLPFFILPQVLQQTVCNHLLLADGRPVINTFVTFFFFSCCSQGKLQRGVYLVLSDPEGWVHPYPRREGMAAGGHGIWSSKLRAQTLNHKHPAKSELGVVCMLKAYL